MVALSRMKVLNVVRKMSRVAMIGGLFSGQGEDCHDRLLQSICVAITLRKIPKSDNLPPLTYSPLIANLVAEASPPHVKSETQDSRTHHDFRRM